MAPVESFVDGVVLLGVDVDLALLQQGAIQVKP
jgi:hypothetical protein